MLVLFDIDATLLTTQHAGVLAVADAGRELFGPTFCHDLVQYAGGLDPVIMERLLKVHDLPHDADRVQQFRAAYGHFLDIRLQKPNMASPLPGVIELLDKLANLDRCAVGLLTGNFPETGAAKLAAAGLDVDRFVICAWGCDSPHQEALRTHLPPVAMSRYRETFGADIAPDRVTIVGDTEHDIRCAKDNGCRALGVATGAESVDDLLAVGADCAVETLADTPSILAWLTAPLQATPTKFHLTPSPRGRGPG